MHRQCVAKQAQSSLGQLRPLLDRRVEIQPPPRAGQVERLYGGQGGCGQHRQVLAVADEAGHGDGVHVRRHRDWTGPTGQPQSCAVGGHRGTERQSDQGVTLGGGLRVGHADTVEQPGGDGQVGDGQRTRCVPVRLGNDAEIHMAAADFGREQRQQSRFRSMGHRRGVDRHGAVVQRRADAGNGLVATEPGPLRLGELVLFVAQSEVHGNPFSKLT